MTEAKTLTRLSVDECNCNALRKAARRVSQFYDNKLRPTGLRISQFTILVIIWERASVSVNELAAYIELDRTTTGKNLRPLERAGLVLIAPDPADRRAKIVRLTPLGEQTLKRAAPLWREAQREFALRNGDIESAQMRATVLDLNVGGIEL